MVAMVIETLLGYLTFTAQPDGLRETAGDCCRTRPMTYQGQNFVNFAAVRYRRRAWRAR